MTNFNLYFGLSLLLSAGLLALTSQTSYGGEGGATGGGASPDAATFTGDTFSAPNAVVITVPASKTAGLQVNPKDGTMSFTPYVECKLRTVAILINSALADKLTAKVIEAYPPIFPCQPGDSCAVSSETAALGQQLQEDLKIAPGSPQYQQIENLLQTLQGLTWQRQISPQQLDASINAYNALVNSLDGEGLRAWQESSEGKNVRSVLQKLRQAVTYP